MDIYELSDKRIAAEWGNHVRALRLRKNRTQKNLAETVDVSLNVIKALELGNAKLTTLIAVLRELGSLDSLNQLIFQPTISPLQIAKMKGKKRQRASHEPLKKDKPILPEDSEW